MKTSLKWRLTKLPTVDELTLLVEKNIVTKEEAKEILFNNETEEERDKKSLESEIKFLREMVETLSKKDNTKIIEVIRQVEKPYNQFEWYKPYYFFTNNGGGYSDTILCSNNTTTLTEGNNGGGSFTNIQTF